MKSMHRIMGDNQIGDRLCLRSRGGRFLCFCILLFFCTSSSWAVGLFTAGNGYATGGVPYVTVAADVNRDGKIDLIAGSFGCTDCVGVRLGNGDGTFQGLLTFNSGDFPTSIAVADVNGDSNPDLLVTTTCFSQNCTGAVAVLLGNGNGTFQAPKIYSSGGYGANSVVALDVNGDHKLDLLVANACVAANNCGGDGLIGVLLGKGNGTFQSAQTYDSGGPFAISIKAADLNADGKADLIVANGCQYYNACAAGDGVVAILMGNGNGTFQVPQTYSSGANSPEAISVADVNGDGHFDVLVTNDCEVFSLCGLADGRVGVLLGNGNGTFQSAQTYDAGGRFVGSIAVMDADRDGKPDLILTNACGPKGKCGLQLGIVSVLLGNGDGTFQTPQAYKTGHGPRSVAVADLNGDTKLDLLVAEDSSVAVFFGTARWHTSATLESNLNPSVYGQKVTLTARVTSPGPDAPAGMVKFMSGGVSLGKANLNNGVATLVTSKMAAGALSLTAAYLGDTQSAPSTSSAKLQTVHQASSATSITSSANPSVQGQPVTFTAKVTSPTAKITGTVTFTAGANTLGTVQLSAGHASVTTSALPKGTTSVSAVYNGTPNIVGSSASLAQVVN
jgi:hypothetical protein